jgi:hypothetical protein
MEDVSRHAQVHEEVTPALERENQILATAPYVGDPLALEGGGDRVRRLRPRQPRIEDLDAFEPPTRQAACKSRANRLDLGKLGHDRFAPRASGEDVEDEGPPLGLVGGDPVGRRDLGDRPRRRVLSARVDDGERLAGLDAVAPLRETDDADRVVDLVFLA